MEIFACPVCGAPLTASPRLYGCENGHRFDRSRQGYVNLLLSQKSASKHSGDDKMMIKARREFLSRGFYAPLLNALLEEAAPFVGENGVLLDLGCGEGYYTEGFCRRFPSLLCCGIDISKEALSEAGKRGFPFSGAVASAFRLPVLSCSCDLLLNVFAPCSARESARVLKEGGALLRAVPLEEHLWELKESVYEKPYLNPPPDTALEGFSLLKERDVRYTLALESEDILRLFKMTPYYYKTSRTDQEKCERLQRLTVQAAFRVLVYIKLN